MSGDDCVLCCAEHGRVHRRVEHHCWIVDHAERCWRRRLAAQGTTPADGGADGQVSGWKISSWQVSGWQIPTARRDQRLTAANMEGRRRSCSRLTSIGVVVASRSHWQTIWQRAKKESQSRRNHSKNWMLAGRVFGRGTSSQYHSRSECGPLRKRAIAE